MKLPAYLLLACALPFAAGCRNDPYMTAVFESMNAEKRALEDRIYELQDEHDHLEDQLASTRRENNRLRKDLGGSSGADEEEQPKPRRSSVLPRGILPGGSVPTPEEPKIEFGTPGAGEQDGPARPGPRNLEMNGPARRAPRGAPNELPAPANDIEGVSYEEPVDQRVTHIVLNPFLTGGHDFDHKPGDDGVAVYIEPRNADDDFVAQPGPVSIVVIDPTKEGPEARIARWDFDAHEARERMRKSRFGKGIQLKLPWPNDPPDGNRIHIFVRYETEDGRKLEADREAHIALPGQYSHRWTPRSFESLAGRGGEESSSVLVGHISEAPRSANSSAAPTRPAGKSSSTGGSGTARRRPAWEPTR